MKNLIYTVSTKSYFPILSLFISSIRKYNDIDILCITDSKEHEHNPYKPVYKNVFIKDIQTKDFNFESKYSLFKWDKHINYDNFLYLDADHICKSNLEFLFQIINEQPDKIHSVIEHQSLNFSGINHKFSDKIYNDNCCAYNAGCFGFTQKNKKNIEDIIPFINKNSQFVLHEQPLFNEFFTEKNLLIPSLSEHVFLDCDCQNHRKINSNKNLNNIKLIHTLSGFGEIQKKFVKMYDIINNYVLITF